MKKIKKKINDAYDFAVEYFIANHQKIGKAYVDPSFSEFGFLFRFLAVDGHGGRSCGCPHMIKLSKSNDDVCWQAEGPNAAIINEACYTAKLPAELSNECTVKELKEFARIQRLADKLIPGRLIPKKVGKGKWILL